MYIEDCNIYLFDGIIQMLNEYYFKGVNITKENYHNYVIFNMDYKNRVIEVKDKINNDTLITSEFIKITTKKGNTAIYYHSIAHPKTNKRYK